MSTDDGYYGIICISRSLIVCIIPVYSQVNGLEARVLIPPSKMENGTTGANFSRGTITSFYAHTIVQVVFTQYNSIYRFTQ